MAFFNFIKQTKLDKGSANTERICGKITLMLQKKPPLKIENEFKSLLVALEKVPPSNALDIRRIENRILIKLEEIKHLLDAEGHKNKVLSLTSDVALLLIERDHKYKKHLKE